MAKNNEEKRNSETSIDINGRMEAIDQSLRSVDNRLRAVEKRLSGRMSERELDDSMTDIENLGIKDIRGEFEKLQNSLEFLQRSVEEVRNESIIKDMAIRLNNLQAEIAKLNNKIGLSGRDEGKMQADIGDLQEKARISEDRFARMEVQLAGTDHRIARIENVNKITIGKIKVPLEFSGLVAAFVLLGTGYLIYTDHWSIIRSSYYPITIGMLFGIVVIVKFIMTNRE